ncbi:hypothetical protein [Pragia fontium]|uniref:hypothetical protein n=1 Tax=Pragia fontium TaxID=82985 RepID=UPI000F6C72A2|nr:hypothetical protein [Pragia fontium]VEJ54590.1 Uncharacterised protein [Pragia fontium]
MPTYQELYEFIKSHYKPSRFENRNGKEWGERYSHNIAKHHMESLEKYGESNISQHEDITGQGLKFNTELKICRGEQVEYRSKAGNLTHIF